MRAAWDALPAGERTAAVLVRRRSQIPLLSEALQAEGLPVEVVGLGGLLTTPEVVDVVATLRVLVRHDTGTALARLLTGARWRIGASDLAALAPAGAARLARPAGRAPSSATPTGEPVSLVEALDDLGPAERLLGRGLPPADAAVRRTAPAAPAASAPRCPNWSPTSSARSASTSRSRPAPTGRTSAAPTSTGSSTRPPTSPTRPTRPR